LRLAENTERKKSPKIRHLCTIAQLCRSSSCTSQLRHVSTFEKNVKLQYILYMSHNIVDFGPLAAEIGLPDWGTPANFNGFRLLASLLHRRHSPEANQTYTTFGCLLGWYTAYTFFRGSFGNFARCKIHFASKSCPVLYWHSSSGRQPNFAAWYKERN